MDASLIYAASNELKCKVSWIQVSAETEWLYFGAGDDVDEAIAMEKITDYFPDQALLVAIDRRQSAAVVHRDLKTFLHGILGVKKFFIWDNSFKRVMEFSDIGVMRRGFIRS